MESFHVLPDRPGWRLGRFARFIWHVNSCESFWFLGPLPQGMFRHLPDVSAANPTVPIHLKESHYGNRDSKMVQRN